MACFSFIIRVVLLPLVIVGFSTGRLSAQTWQEWFAQKKTQRKYLLEQLLSLKTYAIAAKRGYNFARDGWHLAGDLSKGEFTAHQRYFSSLNSPPGWLSSLPQVQAIRARAASVRNYLGELKKLFSLAKIVEQLQPSIRHIEAELLQEERELNSLLSNQIRINEAARLARLAKLEQSSIQRWAFTLELLRSASELAARQSKEVNELMRVGGWHE
ncbi:hypothetical protein [Pedobacter sp. SYP-B3415]|uniref:hypothetical protein n=1 Tax=Pedobacter sp. SYP-B3415 TaxID=2496641 RepID=UPI00101BFB37|nr:hypothetical protein [Pedobacter sp. SYP-B3415]